MGLFGSNISSEMNSDDIPTEDEPYLVFFD